jgi:hypothetical protein
MVGAGFIAWQLLQGTADEAAKVIGLVLGLLAVFGAVSKGLQWLWRQSRPAEVGRPSAQHVDDLAATVRSQWEEEATRRKLLAPAPLPIRWTLAAPELRGPVESAVGVPGQPSRFQTLPGLPDVTGQILSCGGGRAELHRVYGGLPSGRLVITGEPGVGKTGAGIMLLLDALAHRARLSDDERVKVPVPVMFTLADWDPNVASFEGWLEGKLAATYYAGQAGRQQAKAVVDDGQVAAFVDGLDEINADLRPIALEAMSASRVRLVLLTRTEEMAIAAREHRLMDAAVLELCAVEAAAAADYLHRALPGQPPAHWDDLLDQLRARPEGHLAGSLRTPLTLTLVRDTYRAGDDVSDLLDASHTSEPRTIEEHLLDRIIGAAYTPRPGERYPAYNAGEAERTLSFLAERMIRDGTRDLAWWHLRRWAPRWPRLLTRVLPVGLAIALTITITLPEDPWELWDLLAFLGILSLGGLGYRLQGRGPHRVRPLRWSSIVTRRALKVGLAGGLAFGFLGVVFWFIIFGYSIAYALMFGLAGGFAFAIVAGITQPGADVTAPVRPMALWRSDQRAAFLFGLTFGLMTGAAFSFYVFVDELSFGEVQWSEFLLGVLIVVPSFGLIAALLGWLWSMAVTTRLAIGQLAIGHRVPMRLLHFLEDARTREILRTVGPVYQFRHARLQDHLALRHQLNTAKSPRLTV